MSTGGYLLTKSVWSALSRNSARADSSTIRINLRVPSRARTLWMLKEPASAPISKTTSGVSFLPAFMVCLPKLLFPTCVHFFQFFHKEIQIFKFFLPMMKAHSSGQSKVAFTRVTCFCQNHHPTGD